MGDMIEGHPIPQDITGFQFRLIGDMTVKQFAYLAVGLVFGWFVFLLPVLFIFKLLLASIPVLTGLILAFVPIQGVPADTILGLFFRALLRPNQYMYDKVGKNFKETDSQKKETPIVKNIIGDTQIKSQEKPQQNVPQMIKVEQVPLQPATKPIGTPPINAPVPTHQTTPPTPPSPPPTTTPQIPPVPQTTTISEPIINPLEKQLQDVLAQKKALEEQLQTLKQQPPPQQQTTTSVQPPPASYVKVTDQPKKVGNAPFMPDVPNLIAGIIKDARGNILPNILVEVKDKDDNPVRAFKTNALGQFASATPLLSDTYTITFEDPKKTQRFDTIELSVNGTIIPPLEITSIDEREELRKQLFEPK